MELFYTGKTKNVYKINEQNFKLVFKDDVTGTNGVFDPGANTVGLQIDGIGKAALNMTTHFFKKLNDSGIKTHWVSTNLADSSMVVLAAEPFGKGIEVICRYRAIGSYYRRYGKYLTEGQSIKPLVEITLKDDERNDPVVTSDTMELLGIMSYTEYSLLKSMMKEICAIIRDELATKDLELCDIKLEFGRLNGQVILIDEISGGNMRVYRNGAILDPLELANLYS